MENNFIAPKARGRPLGSKNKRKEPERLSQGIEPVPAGMQLKVLEIAPGADVINAVSDFANLFKVDLSVISAQGMVRMYRPRPPPQRPVFINYEGIYHMLSLMGNFYGSLAGQSSSSFPTSHFILAIDHKGYADCGIVSGKVVAVNRVVLGVAILRDTDCIKLPLPLHPPPPRTIPFSQFGASSSARGSTTSAYGAQYPTPLRMI